jgi:hypothetical protein
MMILHKKKATKGKKNKNKTKKEKRKSHRLKITPSHHDRHPETALRTNYPDVLTDPDDAYVFYISIRWVYS